jgi:cell division protein ZapA (FtsZ GTPase activity inhibitor)
MAKKDRTLKSDLYIEILGTSLCISAEEDPAYLANLLDNYRSAVEHIQKSTSLKDALKIAVLTGFLLCDEIQRMDKKQSSEQEARESETRETELIAQDLVSRIDEVLEGRQFSS